VTSSRGRATDRDEAFEPRPAPTAGDLARWRSADQGARKLRGEHLRERLEEAGIDAYFGVGRENTRYLTGFELRDGEEKVAGDSGRFLVSRDEVVVFVDSRYREQAGGQCPESRLVEAYHDLPERWRDVLSSLQPVAGLANAPVRKVAVEEDLVSRGAWRRLAAAAPKVELVASPGWVEELRAVKEPSEVERIGAAAGVADAALASILPAIAAGQTEREIALRLEWEMRTHGAEALAFGVACLGGPRAALPHGSPGPRPIARGEVLLLDFGAQVAGYRSDMTRTLFVGEPTARDLDLYGLVTAAQQDALAALALAVASGQAPTGPEVDAVARQRIAAGGLADRFGHGLGHGIGLATHEPPSVSYRGVAVPLPSPSVFSVEPGVYLPGETGIRIEDLVLFDVGPGSLELLTRFPRGVTVVGS